MSGYEDDVKTVIKTLAELEEVLKNFDTLRQASGLRIHKDKTAGKVILVCSRGWKKTVKQEDIESEYVLLKPSATFIGFDVARLSELASVPRNLDFWTKCASEMSKLKCCAKNVRELCFATKRHLCLRKRHMCLRKRHECLRKTHECLRKRHECLRKSHLCLRKSLLCLRK